MIQLCDRYNCTGCCACANACPHNAITMIDDYEGFLQPVVNSELCVSCGICQKVCPVISPYDFKDHIMQSYAAYAKDSGIRQRGSSGGLFTIFANNIFKQSGAVVGAAFDDSHVVRHMVVDKESELSKLQGSKYVQSIIGFVLKDIKRRLVRGQKILFVGTPCQVAGLLNYLQRRYENLYTIDLVCHGVPSPKLFAHYIEFLKHKYPNFYSFSFRDLKRQNCSSSSSSFKNPKSGEISTKVLYGEDMAYYSLFIGNYVNRECCYKCCYAQHEHRIGDITLADFWGLGKVVPYNRDKSMGVSFVSINTPKGRELFDSVKSEIEYEERPVEETIVGGNTQLEHPAVRPTIRDGVYKQVYTTDWTDLVKKLNLPLKKKTTLMRRLRNKVSKILDL